MATVKITKYAAAHQYHGTFRLEACKDLVVARTLLICSA
jgi:hypothetical protein